ncbi:MAG: hypothetical protein ABEK50_09745 [bacterium]
METELGWSFSILKQVSPRWQGLLELDAETVLSVEEDSEAGKDKVSLYPGVKYRLDDPSSGTGNQYLGVSVGTPVSGVEAFDQRYKISYFQHF